MKLWFRSTHVDESAWDQNFCRDCKNLIRVGEGIFQKSLERLTTCQSCNKDSSLDRIYIMNEQHEFYNSSPLYEILKLLLAQIEGGFWMLLGGGG